MTISRMALRSAAGFTAVSLGLLACAGMASADEPNANIRPSAGISITGLNLGAGVGSINLGVNGGINLGLSGSVGLDVNGGLGVSAGVDADAGISVGVNALDGQVNADLDVDLDAGVDAGVSLGDGIRKQAEAKIAERRAKVVKATARPRDSHPQIMAAPQAGLSVTGLNAGAGVGGTKLVVVGGAAVNAACTGGAGLNGGVSANVGCDADVQAAIGASLGNGSNGEGRKLSKPGSIRAKAEAKIAERAQR